MTFDQWIDSVNADLHGRLGKSVRTEELSWDSAMWVGSGGTVVASLDTNESTVAFDFDNGEKLSLSYQEAVPESVSATIAARLSARA